MANNTDKTSIILHGHFYQPPRENPNTGIIPKQPSAAPWTDWNERIYDQCYGANLSSRLLDSDGRITRLTNNYAYISFNFGPTLLSWLDKAHPEAIEGLREADRSSILRLGHGNAMAQGFNHTILPLDKVENAKLQIDWGFQDFQYHFKRDPEGMWLPECGVNENVIQLLHDRGIKFIVLSPWQCKAVEDEYGNMKDLGFSPAPYREPFILTGSNGGEVTAFFYEPGLASGISFGHYLHSADNLYNTLLNIKRESNGPVPLLHTATDGEIYGHHEPFGDMALAALISKVNAREDFILDNYASYMEKHPATKHAQLKSGEENRGTSWSCSHGVSRWYKDCGCHTGGEANWNQKWRTGLRNALNNLGNKIDEIFRNEVDAMFQGKLASETLLSEVGAVFCGEVLMKDYLNSLQKKYVFSNDDKEKLAHLLTGMKYKHFSFTSCGWFFSELSGIEPRQDIKYAIHAITLFQPYTDTELMIPFLTDLKAAKCNIKEFKDGMYIAQEELQDLPGEIEAVSYFYMNREVPEASVWKKTYGKYELTSYVRKESEISAVVTDNNTDEAYRFRLLAGNSIDKGLSVYITKLAARGTKPENYHVTMADIPDRVKDEAYTWLDSAMATIPDENLKKETDQVRYFATLYKSVPDTIDARLVENLGVALRLIRSLLLNHPTISTIGRIDVIKDLAIFIREYGRAEERAVLNHIEDTVMKTICNYVSRDGLNEESSTVLLKTLASMREVGREPELKELQNLIYLYYTNQYKANCSKGVLEEVYSSLNFK